MCQTVPSAAAPMAVAPPRTFCQGRRRCWCSGRCSRRRSPPTFVREPAAIRTRAPETRCHSAMALTPLSRRTVRGNADGITGRYGRSEYASELFFRRKSDVCWLRSVFLPDLRPDPLGNGWPDAGRSRGLPQPQPVRWSLAVRRELSATGVAPSSDRRPLQQSPGCHGPAPRRYAISGERETVALVAPGFRPRGDVAVAVPARGRDPACSLARMDRSVSAVRVLCVRCSIALR